MKSQIEKPSTTPGMYHFVTIFQQLKVFKVNCCVAPGEYSPEKSAAVLLDNSPKYTFGMKSQIEKPSTTPGE